MSKAIETAFEILAKDYPKYEDAAEGIKQFFVFFAKNNNKTVTEAIEIMSLRDDVHSWLEGWLAARHFYLFRNICMICGEHISEEEYYRGNICDQCAEDFFDL